MRQLNVHMLPSWVHPHDTAGKTVVVVDILRATTTIAAALANGADAIIPCLEIDEARELATQHRAAGISTLLAGERGGLPIAGFDLGNSPTEYSSEVVKHCLIVLTTTNGTKAMTRCVGAARIITAAFVNLNRVWTAISTDQDVEIICAGTNGEVTREDVLFAGALAERARLADSQCDLNDQARLAVDAWQSLQLGDSTTKHRLAKTLRDTHGGRNLIKIGRGDDVRMSAEIDTMDVLPELDMSTWQIRAR